MRKFTETEVKEARAFLEARGIVPNWFRFTRELMSNLKPFFRLTKNRDGLDIVEETQMVGSLVFAFMDYFETGECPVYMNNLLGSKNPFIRGFLQNAMETGFQAIDETYMQYFSMIKGGETGGQKRWNHLKAQGSENESNKPKKKSGRISFEELKNDSDDEFSFEDV